MHGVIKTFLTQPALTTAALDIADAKLQFKSHSSADDSLVADWILAAGQHFYEQTGRLPIRESLVYYLDRPPVQDKIELPCPPLVSVESIEYRNADGDWTGFDNGDSPLTYPWEAQLTSGVYAPRGWVQLKSGETWPTVLAVPNAFRVNFTAGYATNEATVPALVKSVLYYTVSNFDRFRAGTFVPVAGNPVAIPMGIEDLIRGFKLTALQTIVPRSCL